MAKVYLCCGLIGSGKSTWAKSMAKEQKAIIINRDSLRTMLKGTYVYEKELENLVRDMAVDLVDVALRAGYDVVIDETSLTKKKRASWVNVPQIAIAKSKICLVWFAEKEKNLEYRMKDPRGISREEWSKVLEGMKKSFEDPHADEGFDEIVVYGELVPEKA